MTPAISGDTSIAIKQTTKDNHKRRNTMAIHRATNNTRPKRQHQSLYNDHLSLKLPLDQIVRFLSDTIPQYSSDADLRSAADWACAHFVKHVEKKGIDVGEHCKEDLYHIDTALDAFIGSVSTDLPAPVIFEAHFLRGLVEETLHQYKLATQSYLKALWIASSAKDIPGEQLAGTMHHLGKCYGSVGAYEEANAILRRSLAEYASSHVPKRHSCVVDAELTIRRLSEERIRHEQATHSSRRGGRLPLIPEEPSM